MELTVRTFFSTRPTSQSFVASVSPPSYHFTQANTKPFPNMLRNTLLKGRAVNWAITAWLVFCVKQFVKVDELLI